MIYLRLFFEFCKVGLFSVGGGLATIPFLTDLGRRTGWFTQAQLADMIAVSESTPGPMGVNMATYVGFTTGGVPGAVVATLGLIFPSIIIILIIARFLKKFRENQLVENVFYGLRPASIAMISAAGLNVAKIALVNMDALTNGAGLGEFFIWKALILAVLIFIGQKKLKWHPVIFLGISAVVGIIFKF